MTLGSVRYCAEKQGGRCSTRPGAGSARTRARAAGLAYNEAHQSLALALI